MGDSNGDTTIRKFMRRRRFIRNASGLGLLVGVGSGTAAGQATYSKEFQPPYTPLEEQLGSQVSPEHADHEVREADTSSISDGSLSLTLSGSLKSEGKFGLKASPGVEVQWTAPKSGIYKVTAAYEYIGEYAQKPSGEDISLVTSSEPTLAVLTSAGEPIASRTEIAFEIGERTFTEREAAQMAAEHMLEFLARKLVLRYFGPLGNIIGTVVLNLLPLWDTPSEGRIDGWFGFPIGKESYVWFEGKKGTTYTLRFTSPGGFVGSIEQNENSFDSELQTSYNLQSLSIEEREVHPRWGARWWDKKLGNETKPINSYVYSRSREQSTEPVFEETDESQTG